MDKDMAFDEFRRFVLAEKTLRMVYSTHAGALLMSFDGNGGSAEVEFTDDGISGHITGGGCYHWEIFPTREDFRCGVKKIKDLIG